MSFFSGLRSVSRNSRVWLLDSFYSSVFRSRAWGVQRDIVRAIRFYTRSPHNSSAVSVPVGISGV